MVIKSLRFKQIGSYAEESFWEPKIGVTGIIAEHEENHLKSNGIGKSTLGMTIPYALYGKGTFGTIDEIIYDKADPVDAFVECIFEKNSNTYKIYRGRKKTSPILTIHENDIKLGNEQTTIAQKQKLIDDIIGMDYDMFTATVFFEQKKADKFINTGSAQSTEYLDKCLKITPLREVIKTSTTEVTQKKKALELQKTEVISLTKKWEELKLQIESTKFDPKDIEINELNKALIEKELLDLNVQLGQSSEIVAINNSIAELTKSIADNVAGIKALESHKVVLNSKLEQNYNLIEVIKNKISALGNAPDYSVEINNTLNLIETHKIEILENELKRTSQINKLNTITESYNTCLSDLRVNKTEIEFISKGLLKISIGTCPTCNQDVTEVYLQSEKEKIDLKIKDLNSIGDNFQILLNTLQDNLNQENILLESINDNIRLNNNAIVSETNRITELKDAEKEYANSKKVLTSEFKSSTDIKDSLLSNLLSENNQIATMESIKEVHEKELEVLRGKLSIIQTIDIQAIVSLIESKKLEISSLSNKIKEAHITEGWLKASGENLKAFSQAVIDCETLINISSKEINLLNIAIAIDKDMIEDEFSNSIKLIEYHSNNFLQKVYPNFSISIYRDLESKREPLVYKFICDGSDRSYTRLSGGQQTVVDIALRLGFSKTLIDRSQVKIDFVFLDEPFGALDEVNREEVKKILVGLRDSLKQIFIISHTPDAKDCENMVKVVMNKKSQSRVIVA